MRRRTIGLIVIGLLLGGLTLFYAWRHRPGQRQGGAVPVIITQVKVQTTKKFIYAVGNLFADEGITLRPEIPGVVKKINFQEGQFVEQDAVLIELDNAIPQAEYDEANAQLTLSELQYKRASQLLDKNVGSVFDKDNAEAKLKIDEANSAIKLATLNKYTLRAPFPGMVGLRSFNVGDYVREGQALVNLTDTRTLKVNFGVPEIFLQDLKTGQTVLLRVDAMPNQVFTGTIYAIDPQIDLNTHQVSVKALLPNPDNILKPGLFADIELFVKEIPNQIWVPEQTLVPQGDKQYVYRVVDNKAVWTEVEIGQRTEGWVEILQGLSPEDKVITAGQIKIYPGASVQAAPTKGPAS